MKRFKKVYIEITNICNLSCSFCPKTKRAPRSMSTDEFVHVLDEVRPYTDYIYLHLMGEPFLHPQLAQLLKLCEERCIRVNITTNGVLIKRVKEILLTAPALRKVGFSLHSFEANQSEQALEAYIEDVLSFVQTARETELICELRLWNNDSDEKSGANALNMRIIRMIEERLDVTVGEILATQGSVKLRERLYLGFAQIFDWPDAAQQDTNDAAFCYGLRDQIGILSDGTVVPCCLDSEGTIALGNVFADPLSQILASERAQRIYNGFSRREAVEGLCKSCGYAQRF
ncbi:radical SAM protein [Oscillospiraceae bacterium PP1C4]